jgi:multidrug efflux pump subunit AcrA (membrane-fusion protein)
VAKNRPWKEKVMKVTVNVMLALFVLLSILLPLSIAAKEIAVAVKPVTTKVFAECLQIQGSAEAVNTAKVSARIPGPIEAVFVEEGDQVEAGVTCLFQIDSVKLQKNVEIRKQELAIARYSLKEKEAQRKQAVADLEKARLDFDRFRLLWEENSTSKDNYEKIQLKHRMSELTVEHVQAIIDLAGEQLKQAELAVRIAEKDFADSKVYAPISGRVIARMQEPGEMAAPGIPILLIKDLKEVEVKAYLPAEYYHRVIPGSTTVEISTRASRPTETVITYKSPVIDPALRTFQIKCSSLAHESQMIPGELVELNVLLLRREGLAVPDNAILQREQSRIVFIVENGKARMVKVTCGLENDGMTEVFSDQLKPEMQLISQGQYLLNDGQPVKISAGGR